MNMKIKLKNLFRVKPTTGKRWRYANNGLTKISIEEDP